MRMRLIVDNNRGVALVMALIISVAIMAMVTGMLYVVNQNTKISGSGKRYTTAEEAADGAINVVKDTVNLALWGDLDAVNSLFSGACDNDSGSSMSSAILSENVPCTKTLTLDSLGGHFEATITAERLYSISMPGSRIEFAKSAGGVPGTAIFFRITSVVTGPKNTRAETSALYRFAG
jgi:hypothetical protein